jgi:hypothetical protein
VHNNNNFIKWQGMLINMKNNIGKYLKLVKGGIEVKNPTVHDVANYFLSLVDYDAGSSMTHLKLQKMGLLCLSMEHGFFR